MKNTERLRKPIGKHLVFLSFYSVAPTTVGLSLSAAASQTPASASASRSSASTPADIRASLGSTTTLKAEVLWCLHTIMKHQSYNANEAAWEIFQTILKLLVHLRGGKDKTAYIVRFGLGPYVANRKGTF